MFGNWRFGSTRGGHHNNWTRDWEQGIGKWELENRQTNKPAPKRQRLFFRLPALKPPNGNERVDFGVTRFSISEHRAQSRDLRTKNPGFYPRLRLFLAWVRMSLLLSLLLSVHFIIIGSLQMFFRFWFCFHFHLQCLVSELSRFPKSEREGSS